MVNFVLVSRWHFSVIGSIRVITASVYPGVFSDSLNIVIEPSYPTSKLSNKNAQNNDFS